MAYNYENKYPPQSSLKPIVSQLVSNDCSNKTEAPTANVLTPFPGQTIATGSRNTAQIICSTYINFSNDTNETGPILDAGGITDIFDKDGVRIGLIAAVADGLGHDPVDTQANLSTAQVAISAVNSILNTFAKNDVDGFGQADTQANLSIISIVNSVLNIFASPQCQLTFAKNDLAKLLTSTSNDIRTTLSPMYKDRDSSLAFASIMHTDKGYAG
ncbi:MAG: hypothetical protein ACK4PR_06090, partial [Gammaproteobacteria bacterium]